MDGEQTSRDLGLDKVLLPKSKEFSECVSHAYNLRMDATCHFVSILTNLCFPV